ncbi:helix-turn-helix domain-containing protein [Kroppenstedtia eburnea]|uniref:helix-turn-helix domain-containing protein n=1 Tax=Kroppenstedtia eburnea TaxID=714067 RepID=UPI00362F5F42
MSSLGSRLRAAREKRGWTQTYVCKKLGIPNSTLSGYERDYRSPDPELIRKFADLYEISTDYLLGYQNDFSTEVDLIDQLKDKKITFEGRELTEKQKKRVIRILKAFLLDDEDKEKE